MLGKFGEMLPSGLTPNMDFRVAAGGVAGDITVTGIKALDSLLAVLVFGGTGTLPNGLVTVGTLAKDAVAEKFKTTTTAVYRIGGIQYSKAATTALVFSAADTINTAAGAGQFWGIWLVQINAAGAVSTKSPAADQTYANEAAAIAALPAADAGNVALGYITVQSKEATSWTATTDDLTAASDCAAANFVDADVLGTSVAVSLTNLTSEFSITAADTINNTGGTSTAGATLLVVSLSQADDYPAFARP